MKVHFTTSQNLLQEPRLRPSVTPLRFGQIGSDTFERPFNTSDLFAKALKNEGVDCVYGVPGEETLDLLEALRKTGIRFITTRDEEAAGFMAATHGRLTGKPGVCLTTLGPGAAKLSNCAAYASLGGIPLIMITGQKPIRDNQQGLFQIVDIMSMLKPVTKATHRIENGGQIPKMVREAFHQASIDRPGAVHLELPEDVAGEPVDPQTPLFAVNSAVSSTRPQASESSLNAAAKLISQAKRPLLMIGAGAKREPMRAALEDFVKKTGIPFFNTQLGKGTIDEHNPLYLGTAALSENDYLHSVIERADLIISIGHEIEEKPPFLMKRDNPQKVLHVGPSPAEVDTVWFPQQELIGGMANNLNRLSEKLGESMSPAGLFKNPFRKEPPPTLDYDKPFYQQAISGIGEHVSSHSRDDGFPIIPQRIVSDVQSAMPNDGIVALDNGMYKIWFTRNYKARHPDSLLLDNTLATMGAGLPSAMEAARLYPNRKVLAVCGDGGFMMSLQELETAVREKLNLTVLLLNDNGYGMIQWKQRTHNLPDYGLKFGNPDFLKLAESFGVKGYRIAKADDLQPTIQQCLSNGGVNLIEVPMDDTQNQKILVDELKHKSSIFVK